MSSVKLLRRNGWAIVDGCIVMGGLAALRVRPVARNLYGAKMASERIVPALINSRAGLDQVRSA